jgi:hypothetical protein
VKPFKFYVFLLLWDTTKEVFFRCGIQTEEFFSAVGYNGEGFPTLWDTTEEDFFPCGVHGEQSQDGKQILFYCIHNAGNFSSVVSYTSTESCAVYCIPEKSSALYRTTPQVFFCCIPQWKIFSSVLGYNGRGFFRCGIQQKKLSSIVRYNGRVFFHCGIQWKRFFSVVGYNGKKHTTHLIFLNFKCL